MRHESLVYRALYTFQELKHITAPSAAVARLPGPCYNTGPSLGALESATLSGGMRAPS